MGIRGPIAVSFDQAFPFGVFAMGVTQAQDFNEKNGRRTPAKDDNGQLVWTVSGIDRDPEAKKKDVKIKVSAPVQPVLPGEEIAPGTGMFPVEFDGLTVRPYVSEGWIAWSYRATGMRAPAAAAGSTSSGKQVSAKAALGSSGDR